MEKQIIRQEQQKGKTIFLTTHNMHDAEELCDRVAFIDNGAIQLIDSPQSLKLQYGKPVVKVSYLNEVEKTAEFDIQKFGAHP